MNWQINNLIVNLYYSKNNIVQTCKKFFIADDDPDDLELFIEALQQIDAECECVTAFNGLEALDKLSKQPFYIPDFIFLDLNMPRMNGKECLVEIKKSDRLKKIPVIMYSTSGERKYIQETMELGAVFFFQKPNRFGEFIQALQHIVSPSWKTN